MIIFFDLLQLDIFLFPVLDAMCNLRPPLWRRRKSLRMRSAIRLQKAGPSFDVQKRRWKTAWRGDQKRCFLNVFMKILKCCLVFLVGCFKLKQQKLWGQSWSLFLILLFFFKSRLCRKIGSSMPLQCGFGRTFEWKVVTWQSQMFHLNQALTTQTSHSMLWTPNMSYPILVLQLPIRLMFRGVAIASLVAIHWSPSILMLKCFQATLMVSSKSFWMSQTDVLFKSQPTIRMSELSNDWIIMNYQP